MKMKVPSTERALFLIALTRTTPSMTHVPKWDWQYEGISGAVPVISNPLVGFAASVGLRPRVGMDVRKGGPMVFESRPLSGRMEARYVHTSTPTVVGTSSSRRPSPNGACGVRIILLVCWGLLAAILLGPDSARAQTNDDAGETSLVERYQKARYRALARRHLRQEGRFPVYPPTEFSVPTDSLRPDQSGRASTTAQESSFPLHDVRPVRRQEKDWFRTRFADTKWTFLGETPHHTFLDTTRTPDLRARLQARFGNPTRTLADAPLEKPPGERLQFEYWFVVNDSIPVQVTDVSGPKGRGLIVAAERPYRDRLQALRDTLLAAPLQHSDRTPYVDYYYDEWRERWYRTGFDGQSFFLKQIPRTDVVAGQRAHLDTVRTSESSPSSDESTP